MKLDKQRRAAAGGLHPARAPALRARAQVRGDHARQPVGAGLRRRLDHPAHPGQAASPSRSTSSSNMFDARPRGSGQRNSLRRLRRRRSPAAAQDLNAAIAGLQAPAHRPRAGARRTCRSPQTQLAALLPRAGRHRERGRAGRRAAGGRCSRNLDTTFTALASVARPFIQETISRARRRRAGRDRDLPAAAALHAQPHRLLPELRPGVAMLPHSAPILADALRGGRARRCRRRRR